MPTVRRIAMRGAHEAGSESRKPLHVARRAWLGTIALLLAACAALLVSNPAAAQVQFTSLPVTSATAGQPYVYDVVVSTSGATVSITAPFGLPPWLSLVRTGNGTATLSGTPPASGTANVYLRAQYGACVRFAFLCPTQSFTITIADVPNAPPVVVPPGLTDRAVSQNEAFSLDVAPAFSDPEGQPLAFSATGLPGGFLLVGSTISGLATAATVAGSPYTITVTATDNRGGSVADSFVLSAVPLGRADVFLSAIEATPSPAAAGAPVDWVITVGNNGPSPSGSVNVTLDLAGAELALSTNPCTATATANGQRLACTVEPIAGGATQTITLTGSVAAPGDVYAVATVESAALVPIDPNTGNNAGTASLSIGDVVGEAAQTLAVGASAVSAGDFTGDGYGDVVRAARGAEPALLLDIENPTELNPALAEPGDQRRGLASVPLSFGAAAASRDVAIGDFDNDGHLDAVFANGAGAASAVFRGDGTGVMTALATLGAAASDDRAVATADVNGDGYLDVVIANAAGNTLHVSQNGTAFSASALPAHAGAGAVDVVLADVLGSPLPDLVLVYGSGPVLRHENLGGTFGPAVTIDPGPAFAAASADFNGDGRADLVLARSTPSADGIAANPVYLNDGGSGFTAAGTFGALPTAALLTGDLNGDGASDIVAVNAGGTHRLFVGDGTGNFTPHPRVLVSRGATSGAIAPFGRAQRNDLVLAGPDATHVFFNDGRGNLGLGDTTRPVIALKGTPEISMAVADTFTDPGADATDDVDGTLTPTVSNPVNPAIVGTYTVSYAAMDSAGNAAAPVSRAVHVTALEPEGGGGGGAAAWPLLGLLIAPLLARRRSHRSRSSSVCISEGGRPSRAGSRPSECARPG